VNLLLTNKQSATSGVTVRRAIEAVLKGFSHVTTYLKSVIEINSDPEVEIYAFKGENRDYFFGIDPRLRFGHVGVSLDKGKTIYGFNPHKPPEMSMEEFIGQLREGKSFAGRLQNDTILFTQAGSSDLQVRVVTCHISGGLFRRVKKLLKDDLKNSPMRDKRYSFPQRDLLTFEQGCFNCATYLTTLGLENPYPSGKLGDYL
jgi:hypothetical protein